MDWDTFDSQFREAPDDKWRRIKAERKAKGLCWQCAKPPAECKCWDAQRAKV